MTRGAESRERIHIERDTLIAGFLANGNAFFIAARITRNKSGER